VLLSCLGVCRISYIDELSSSQYVTVSSSIRPFFTDTIEVGILRLIVRSFAPFPLQKFHRYYDLG
ncbi:TPA: hypothetical protein ACGO63_002176, partial [Streptococcus suis]